MLENNEMSPPHKLELSLIVIRLKKFSPMRTKPRPLHCRVLILSVEICTIPKPIHQRTIIEPVVPLKSHPISPMFSGGRKIKSWY